MTRKSKKKIKPPRKELKRVLQPKKRSLPDETLDQAENLSGLPGEKGKKRIIEAGHS
jgi:hypothetical protein